VVSKRAKNEDRSGGESLREFARLEILAERLQGSCPGFMVGTKLRKMRKDHKWPASKSKLR